MPTKYHQRNMPDNTMVLQLPYCPRELANKIKAEAALKGRHAWEHALRILAYGMGYELPPEVQALYLEHKNTNA